MRLKGRVLAEVFYSRNTKFIIVKSAWQHAEKDAPEWHTYYNWEVYNMNSSGMEMILVMKSFFLLL